MVSLSRFTSSVLLFLFSSLLFGKAATNQYSPNLCLNGGFEQRLDAAASQLPQAWSPVGQGSSRQVELVTEAAEGKYALRLAAHGPDIAGVNGTVIEAGRGQVRFRYKVVRSDVGGKNLAFNVIALNEVTGIEVPGRKSFVPAPEHVGDGQWHEAVLDFDLRGQQTRCCLVAPRVNESTPATGDGEWLIDDVRVYRTQPKAEISVAYLWSDKPLARNGEPVRFSAFVENTGDDVATNVIVMVNVQGGGISPTDARRSLNPLAAGAFARVDWHWTTSSPGPVLVTVAAETAEMKTPAKSYQILVVDRAARLTRQEVCTDEEGWWRQLETPRTFQENNRAALTPVGHKKSSDIRRNPYGLCVHLPRAKDYEHPFNPAHLIDDDPKTCWSSQQRPGPFPGNPPWVEIDLGRPRAIAQVNLIPYWRSTDFPLGFTVLVSANGKDWEPACSVAAHRLDSAGPKRGDKIAQCFPFRREVAARHVRILFERLPLSGGNYAEVSQGYKARLSGIEMLDREGRNVALKTAGATVEASEFFTGWQDTTASINRAFPTIMELGVKWVRVGQWGDQTEWAAVEREQGRFAMDPVTDKAIRQLTDRGVDILWGLNYGNGLYDRPEKPFNDIGPIYREGHPFYLNQGPRTEAGRQAFVRYVDYVVRKYQSRVQWWELWNEENGWYPGHEPELYGKLLYATARHIKSINPNLKVMYGGTAAPAPLTTEIALREGAAPYLDAYAFHPYGIDKPEGGMGTMEFQQAKNLSQSREQMCWNRLEDIVAGVKKPFAQHGNTNIQVWLNEWSLNVSGLDYTYKPGIGEYGLAKYLIRFYIYNGWLGQPTAWWALHTENKSQDWSVLDPDTFGLRPLSYALQNVCSVVSDVTSLPPPEHRFDGAAPDLKVIAYQRDRRDEKLVLVWSARLNTDQIVAHPGRFTFAHPKKPKKVLLTDLYWGLEQPAAWSHENGQITLDGLVVRDYPVVITVR